MTPNVQDRPTVVSIKNYLRKEKNKQSTETDEGPTMLASVEKDRNGEYVASFSCSSPEELIDVIEGCQVLVMRLLRRLKRSSPYLYKKII